MRVGVRVIGSMVQVMLVPIWRKRRRRRKKKRKKIQKRDSSEETCSQTVEGSFSLK